MYMYMCMSEKVVNMTTTLKYLGMFIMDTMKVNNGYIKRQIKCIYTRLEEIF